MGMMMGGAKGKAPDQKGTLARIVATFGADQPFV